MIAPLAASSSFVPSIAPFRRRKSGQPFARRAAVAALSTNAPADEAASSKARHGNPAPSGTPRRRVRARDFRHPLDQQNTQILQAIPGLSNLTKTLVTPLAEQMIILEQISTSVQVGPNQLPHIHRLVLDAAEVLDIPPPQLYIRQSSQPNAYTLAISGREPVVVVHTALIELMTEAELQAGWVLAFFFLEARSIRPKMSTRVARPPGEHSRGRLRGLRLRGRETTRRRHAPGLIA